MVHFDAIENSFVKFLRFHSGTPTLQIVFARIQTGHSAGNQIAGRIAQD
jgi:hypothetical protein